MQRSNKTSCGFTVAELLISVSLMAVLLAAMATAFEGAMSSYDENIKLSALAQASRSIMERMTREIRQADDVEYSTGQLNIFPAPSAGGPDEIRYVLENGSFIYRTIDGGTSSSYMLLAADDEVTVQQFSIETEEVDSRATLVKVTLDFLAGGESLSVTASACPRRNQSDL